MSIAASFYAGPMPISETFGSSGLETSEGKVLSFYRTAVSTKRNSRYKPPHEEDDDDNYNNHNKHNCHCRDDTSNHSSNAIRLAICMEEENEAGR